MLRARGKRHGNVREADFETMLALRAAALDMKLGGRGKCRRHIDRVFGLAIEPRYRTRGIIGRGQRFPVRAVEIKERILGDDGADAALEPLDEVAIEFGKGEMRLVE